MMMTAIRRIGMQQRASRPLYSFAWAQLLAGDAFPKQVNPTFDSETFPGGTKPRTWNTPLDIVDQWNSESNVILPPFLEFDEIEYRPATDMVDIMCIKRTFQPSLIRRKRKWGFLVRMRDRNGRKVINRRRHKKRTRLSL